MGGDFHRVSPSAPAVDAAADKDLLIVLAKRKQHGVAVAVDHRAGIAAGALAVGDDPLARFPSVTAVGAAAQEDVDLIVVAASVAARFAKGQHRTVWRYGQSGDAVGMVAFLAGGE